MLFSGSTRGPTTDSGPVSRVGRSRKETDVKVGVGGVGTRVRDVWVGSGHWSRGLSETCMRRKKNVTGTTETPGVRWTRRGGGYGGYRGTYVYPDPRDGVRGRL